jgi:hypothetical protein
VFIGGFRYFIRQQLRAPIGSLFFEPQVFAVDPADVPLAEGRGALAVAHMRCLGSVAVEHLLLAASEPPVPLAAFVQDANVPTAGRRRTPPRVLLARPLLQRFASLERGCEVDCCFARPITVRAL